MKTINIELDQNEYKDDTTLTEAIKKSLQKTNVLEIENPSKVTFAINEDELLDFAVNQLDQLSNKLNNINTIIDDSFEKMESSHGKYFRLH